MEFFFPRGERNGWEEEKKTPFKYLLNKVTFQREEKIF